MINGRRSIRLNGYDYSQNGCYFLTICVRQKECILGKISNAVPVLSDIGKIADACWQEIPEHFPHVLLHAHCVMPNHIHGIIEITENAKIVGAKNVSPLQNRQHAQGIPKGPSMTLGSIVRGFKIGVTNRIGFSIWQRNYYERIIRNELEFIKTTEYIQRNPENWETDDYHQ